jgi:hypothetical protein
MTLPATAARLRRGYHGVMGPVPTAAQESSAIRAITIEFDSAGFGIFLR